MSPRYPGGPRPALRMPNQPPGSIPGSQPLLPNSLDPTRPQGIDKRVISERLHFRTLQSNLTLASERERFLLIYGIIIDPNSATILTSCTLCVSPQAIQTWAVR